MTEKGTLGEVYARAIAAVDDLSEADKAFGLLEAACMDMLAGRIDANKFYGYCEEALALDQSQLNEKSTQLLSALDQAYSKNCNEGEKTVADSFRQILEAGFNSPLLTAAIANNARRTFECD